MKYLVNLFAHDGIVSHYTGVGTMVGRYIDAIESLCERHEITVNLFTPEYKENSFGYVPERHNKNKSFAERTGGKIFQISNGTNSKANYGNITEWEKLCENTGAVLASFESSQYEKVLNIYNDTPFAQLSMHIPESINQCNVWIPHSTVKIHGVDSALGKKAKADYYATRLRWEDQAIGFINQHDNNYVGAIGNYVRSHLISDYKLDSQKCVDIFNGVIVGVVPEIPRKNKVLEELASGLNAHAPILISFARAEPYKNLEGAMEVGAYMSASFQTVVVAQSYYPTQPILELYKKRAAECAVKLYIDPPFSFPHYLISQHKGPIVVLVPSHKEAMGLIINEVRSLNNDNILLVANDIDGLNEQIEDEKDGLLVNLESGDMKLIASKIQDNISEETRRKYNRAAQNKIASEYNLLYNFKNFFNTIIR